LFVSDRYLEMHKLRENSKVMDTTKSFDNNAAAGNIGQYAPFPFGQFAIRHSVI
jgi:hypothetical protein